MHRNPLGNNKGELAKAATALQHFVQSVVENGAGPLTGSVTYAEDRLGKIGDPEKTINRIIWESTAAAGTTGFVTGLGGVITLPVAIPANIAGTLVINARMIGAIAYLRGYDLNDPYTQTVLMLVVAGTSAQDALALVGMRLGQELTLQAIRQIPITLIREINKKAGFYLLAKYGTKRALITLAKFVPIAGGVISGTVDAGLTRFIGAQGRRAFPPLAVPVKVPAA